MGEKRTPHPSASRRLLTTSTMPLELILNTAQIILAVLLIAAILLQAQGTGVGAVFGGGGNVYRTKRGVEKKLFQLTILLAILFFGVALVNALV